MKKFALGLTALALLCSACSNDETMDVNGKSPNAIGFTASTSGTKAADNNLAAIQGSTSGFGVYATNGASSTQFINNLGYKWTAGSWGWDGTAVAWPTADAGYPVNFYAYYPKTGTNLTTTLTRAYTIAATAGTQVDHLAANKTGVVSRPASSNVELDFKHILSKVSFQVITGADVTVEVQSIAVKNVGSVRTFNFGTFAWQGAAPTVNVPSNVYSTAPVEGGNIFVGATTAASVVNGGDGALMLMPQNLSTRVWNKTAATLGSQTYVEVVYRVYETATNKDIIGYGDATDHPDYGTLGNGETGPLFVKVGFPLPTNWEMGKAYTYTIHLGTNDTSGGNLTDDTFIEDDGTDTDLPVIIDGEEKDIPDPIIDVTKPIGFDVTVSDWGAATNNDLN